MTRTARVTDPSYELMDDHNGLSIIYRQHGFPCPLVRWHFHKEYELHLIVASSGKVFIGDYIGNFYPESLFLTGPNLPHNWISQVAEDEVVPKRDMLVNFTDELFDSGYQVFAELKTLAPLLERAQYGIEFRCKHTIRQAMDLMQRIADTQGVTRLGHFSSCWSCSLPLTTISCCPAPRRRNWLTNTTSIAPTGRWITSSPTMRGSCLWKKSPSTWA